MKRKLLELREEAWLEWQDASLYYELEKQGLGVRFDQARVGREISGPGEWVSVRARAEIPLSCSV